MGRMKDKFLDEMEKLEKATGYDLLFLMDKFNEQLETDHGLDIGVFKARALAHEL